MDNSTRARVLVEALPYIQKYYGKVVVIKYGGNAMKSEELKQAVMGDVALLSTIGVKVVLVHGGGPEITDMLNIMGVKSEFVDGLRVTTKETAEIAQMVLTGKVNKQLVNLLLTNGGRAVGLSGVDGNLIEASMMNERLGYVGEITNINTDPLDGLLKNGYVPVVSTFGRDAEGNIYNINADTAAGRIAAALGAEALITMTDVVGVLRDKDDPASLIRVVHADETDGLIRGGVINGGMIPKTLCCVDAVRRGVKRVFIIDGRVKHSILVEMLTDEGIGTMFTA